MESVCIGVDVGGTNLRCALVNRSGVVIARESQATDIVSGHAPFLSRLLLVIGRLKEQAGAGGLRVAAIGLGVPGLLSNEGIIRSSVNLLPLEGMNLAGAVSSGTGLPVSAICLSGYIILGPSRT